MREIVKQYGPVKSGMAAYTASGLVILLGVSFGVDYVFPGIASRESPKPDFLSACTRHDGLHYIEIADRGYSYDPERRSTVAFFPAYPLLSRITSCLTGLETRSSLLLISNAMLLASFVIFAAYLRCRSPSLDPQTQRLTLALFSLWPATLFCRMSYSESTFLFFLLLMLYGIARRWPILVVALMSGATTATRPVGLAVTAAFLYHLLSDPSRGSLVRRLLLILVYAPIASWGLLVYMGYQSAKFDNHFAFAQTQTHWRNGPSVEGGDIGDKIDALLAGEPIWGAYVPGSFNNWSRIDPNDNFLFNLAFWNPILFVFALLLVLVGIVSRELTGPEVVLSLGLLMIPYLTRAYEMSMSGHARFAAIVLPVYIVLARLLQGLPTWSHSALLLTFATIQMAWVALFAAGYVFV